MSEQDAVLERLKCQALVPPDRQCRRDGKKWVHIHGKGMVVLLCTQHVATIRRSGLWLRSPVRGPDDWIPKQTKWCADCHPKRERGGRDGK